MISITIMADIFKSAIREKVLKSAVFKNTKEEDMSPYGSMKM